MEKQMRAERERREAILRAEGEKASAILVAEGEKQATILRAEGNKISKIAEAEAKAESLKRILEAQAYGIKVINNSKPSKEYLTLKSFESLEKVADGKSTKLIIPSSIQDLSALSASIKEVTKEDKN
jgi:regulator of protease activity HflC (stomatin/prohibitin superfamily)